MRSWIILSLFFFLASCTTPTKPAQTDSTYSGHGSASVDPKIIATFAPPPLDPATATSVRNLLEVSAPGLGVLSPGGDRMFFSWNVTGVSQIWMSDGPMRFPVQLTSGSDPTTLVEITPDGENLILSRDRAGEEDPGLYLMSTKGGPLREIQHKKGSRATFAWVTNDGQTIYYLANDIKPDSYALYSYSVADGKKELLFSEPGLWYVADVHGDNIFLLAKMTGARTREYYVWGRTERKLIPVIGQNEREEYEVSFGPSPSEFFVLTAKLGEFKRLYKYVGGKLTPITPEAKMDVESFNIDNARMRLYVQWNENGYTRLEVRDARTLKRETRLPEFKNADHIYAGKPSRRGRFIPLGIETGVRPRTSYFFDWKNLKLTQWVKPSLPEVDVSQFRPAQLETFPARDGTQIPMLVTRPAKCAADPCPVIVHFHGGPESQSRPGFNRLAQIVAAAGFIFVDPNVRGSEGYGKTYRNADDGPKRLDVVTDIEDCAKHIRAAWAKNGIAPKVGVMGWSYGGYATLMAMTQFAGAYDAGVALVGMSNLRTFLLNTAPYRRILRISEYGDPEKDREALEKLSATAYLDRVRDPLMIIQGVSDPRVPVGEAVQIHELLEKRGIRSPLILFADEGHGTAKRENKVLEIGHTLKFFREHLLTKPVLVPPRP